MSRPSEKVKAHGRCRPHLLGSCLKANGDGLLLLIWGIKTFPLYLFSRSRGAWHLCDVPDPGFIPACVSNVAFFTMCHCQGTCKSTTIMGLILEKWSDLSTHAYVVIKLTSLLKYPQWKKKCVFFLVIWTFFRYFSRIVLFFFAWYF